MEDDFADSVIGNGELEKTAKVIELKRRGGGGLVPLGKGYACAGKTAVLNSWNGKVE